MTNLVIIYTGNVGSTPVVQLAGRHPRAFVPVREEFDRYRIGKYAPGEDPATLLAETLDRLYRREPSPYLSHETVRSRREEDAIPPAGPVPHVVFKWRTEGFGRAAPNAARLRETFARHGARALVLARRSVVEQALKVWLSEVHYGGRHQQFRASRLSEEDYEAYLLAQKTVSIRIDGAGLVRLRAIAGDFLRRTRLTIRAARFQFAHAGTPRLAISEQVLRPEIDYAQASRLLSAALGDEIRLSPDLAPAVRRGGLGIEHCANADAAATDPALRRIERRYRAVLGRLPLMIDARPPMPLGPRLRALVSAPPVALDAPDPLT